MILKISPLLAVLLLLANTAPGVAQVEKSLYKLGLISGEKDPRHESEKERRLREDVLNAATDAFVATRRFTMVERKQLDAVFTEKSLQEFIGGQVNNKLTDVLGLDLVGVVGYTLDVSKSPKGEPVTKCIIDVRLVDVKTAALLATVTSDRPSVILPSSTPREAGQLLYKSIRDAFPPLGYVVSVSGKEVVIDLGSEAGLKKGDTLELVQEGEQIIHPVTGKVLSSPMKVIGELKVVTASPQVSTCKAKVKGEVPVASLVRLKGSRSLFLDWAARVPFLKKSAEDKKEELEK
ncbi:MAG TPA: CsgG/HfaB family protein [Thermoanaerobaculia bacterium]|nr:CsgG/HfaB family protein [Thermoanaerobaculia bacterium]